MSRPNKNLSPENINSIREMLEEGKTPHQIAFALGVTRNCIYWQINKYNIPMEKRRVVTGPRKVVLEEEQDFSSLPDSVLFNPRMFPSF